MQHLQSAARALLESLGIEWEPREERGTPGDIEAVCAALKAAQATYSATRGSIQREGDIAELLVRLDRTERRDESLKEVLAHAAGIQGPVATLEEAVNAVVLALPVRGHGTETNTREALSRAETQAAQARAQVARLESRLSQAQDEAARAGAGMKQLHAAIAALPVPSGSEDTTMAAEAGGAITTLQRAAAHMVDRDRRLQEIIAERDELFSRVGRLKHQLSVAEDGLGQEANSQRTISQLREEISKLRSQAQLPGASRDPKAADALDQLTAMRKTLESQLRAADTLEQKLREQQGRVQELEMLNAQLHEGNQSLHAAVSEMQSQTERLARKHATTAANLRAECKKSADAEQLRGELEEKRTQLEEALAQASLTTESLKATLEQRTAHLEEIKAEMSKQHSTMEAFIADKNAVARALQEETQRCHELMSELKQFKDKAEAGRRDTFGDGLLPRGRSPSGRALEASTQTLTMVPFFLFSFLPLLHIAYFI